MSAKPSVAIIGGGCAGVAAATELVLQGSRVSLFERRPFLGGIASGFRDPGWKSSLEHFYHHWFKSDAFLTHYAKIWGVEDKLVFRRPVTVSETASHGFVQLDSPLSLLAYPELPMLDKIRMGAALAYIKAFPSWRPLERVTARAWCERYMGKRGFEAIWKPLLVGKFGPQFADVVNMAWFWARIRCRTPELGTYRGGFRQLFDDVEGWLSGRGVDVRKSCGDLAITRNGDGWMVNGQPFDRLIVATEPAAFKRLVGEHAPAYAQTITQRPALGVQVVVLSTKRSLGSHYWYSLRKGPENPFLALIEHTNFVPADEFGGEHVLYLADYLSTGVSEWNRSDEELRSLAIRSCARVLPGFSETDVNRHWVFRDPYAQPVVGVNASQSIPPIVVPDAPNLFHLSMAHVYPWDRGTNFAFELGKRVAGILL
jgi:protoporphyrinogen oxidase